MGWSFAYNTNKRQMVAERTESWNTKDRAIQHNINIGRKTTYITYFKAECIKHCYRGNNFSGVLWKVWEWKYYDIHTDELVRTDRWIACDLLRWDKSCNGWGYKDMEESSHPYFYSCPLGYLKLAPEKSKEWREGVRKYHEVRNHKYQIGDIIKLAYCKIPWAVVVYLKPFVGEYNGVRYKIKKGLIDKVITPEELEQEEIIRKAMIKKAAGVVISSTQ
jgi:hypothetical protein